MTQTTSLALQVNAYEAGVSPSGGPFAGNAINFLSQFADGVGAGQFDRIYMAERTVLTAANDDIDLSGTAIQTLLGANIAAVELVGIIVVNAPKDPSAAPNTTNLTIGGGSNPVPGFSAALGTIKPGGCFVLMSPDAAGLATITPGTGDILRIANSAGATNKYQVALFLRSA